MNKNVITEGRLQPGNVAYTMSETMAKELLKMRKGEDEIKLRPNDYLCKVVNEQFGIKGNCVKVIYG